MRRTTIKATLATLALGFLGTFTASACAGTLADVQQRGYVRCGVSTGLPGFAAPDDKGKWTGLDVDFCRAVAAAVLGDASKVQFSPLPDKERFTALQTGAIDLLSHNATWTLTRDAELGVNFIGVMFYDGQGFMVKKSLGVNHIKDLSGATVCTITGTTTELNLADYFRSHKLKYTPLVVDNTAASITAFKDGRCDTLTSDSSQLAALRVKLPDPADAIVLPELISKEPLSPAVADGDKQWEDLVRWTYFAIIRGEELGVTSKNVDEMAKSDNPLIQRLLGTSDHMGKKLGLTDQFAYNAIKQVGNYGEMFDRTVGEHGALGLKRGVNALWTEGGLMYAMPLR
ncbi:amino acid ABC transporter substrate-binding protein [Castellaniella caeni]|uniref:amino acid ABC transporter substrate-binding protein n=1 Tax=Castellaniella caeni TaxID=266123 RepID=UPI0008327864|nr:amino acid ABC transporter substrate-binding protein [Castellaniella caeni]